MRLKVEHTTLFEYAEPIYETATEVRLQPANNNIQKCLSFALAVEPATAIFYYPDYFSNIVHHFNILPPHRHVLIRATSLVETAAAGTHTPGQDDLTAYDFLAETDSVRLDEATAEFASRFVKHEDAHQTAFEICQYLQQNLIYEKGVTNVNSTTTEVLEFGRGVCQDFAHLMIATCRQLGIPARYVSGYFYPGSESEGDDLASHAWCEVWGGPQSGWVAYDPTHSNLYADERYVKIGVGRDYTDVTPVRGTYKGRSNESLKVGVRIYAVSEELAEV